MPENYIKPEASAKSGISPSSVEALGLSMSDSWDKIYLAVRKAHPGISWNEVGNLRDAWEAERMKMNPPEPPSLGRDWVD